MRTMNQLKDARWVAEYFDMPLQRVYELTRSGVLPVVRILRQYRYDPEVLKEWAKQGGTAKDEWRAGKPPDCPACEPYEELPPPARELLVELDGEGE